jgi:DNA replication protein DnaC
MIAEQLFARCMRFNPADRVGCWQTGVGVYSDRTRRPRCFWMRATEFADRVHKDFEYAEWLGRDFLVGVDDVGAAREDGGRTSWLPEALYRLCNARLGKWTIFTTNLSLTEIGRTIDERIASRMIRDGNQFHRINAGDYALRPKKR